MENEAESYLHIKAKSEQVPLKKTKYRMQLGIESVKSLSDKICKRFTYSTKSI